MLENHVEGVFATKRGAGMMVKGRDGALPEQVFEDLAEMLQEFYDRQDKDLLPPDYDLRKRKSYHVPVDSREEIEYQYFDAETQEPLGVNLRIDGVFELAWEGHDVDREEVVFSEGSRYCHLSIRELETERRDQYVKGWDFPHAPHKVRKEKFLVYFNVYIEGDGKQFSKEERNEFLRYVARRYSEIHVTMPKSVS